MTSRHRQEALVIGASVAGLLAARVLSEHFQKVTVVERDPCPLDRLPRKGVPQGKHIHILLPGGAAALDRLFPGRLADLEADGAKRFDYGRSRFYVSGRWLPRVDSELYSFGQTRPFLDEHLLRWVREFPNVDFLYRTNVSNLLFDASGLQVTGVELEKDGEASRAHLLDLVVDATGRNTRLPRWLSEHGFGNVPEINVGINLGYATGCFEVPKDVLPDHPMLYIVGPPPDKTRVGVVFQVENDIVFGGLGGYHGDHPPSDLDGFLRFAQGLSQPHVFNVLSRSKLCSSIVRYQIPSSLRRDYRRLRNFPAGLVPIGDAICSLDPAMGQGMTMAAREAEILKQCLERNQTLDNKFSRDYLRQVDSSLDAAWDLCCGENFKYPQTTGRRPWSFPVTRRYRDLLATSGDPVVLAAAYKVITLTASPRTLLRPALAARAVGCTVVKACKSRIQPCTF